MAIAKFADMLYEETGGMATTVTHIR